MSLHQDLHQQLIQLRRRVADWVGDGLPVAGFNPDYGICGNLPAFPRYYDLLDGLFASWPGGSGSVVFPVPHPLLDPFEAYVALSQSEMWNPEHEYARNRLALLDWLIEQTAPTKESQS